MPLNLEEFKKVIRLKLIGFPYLQRVIYFNYRHRTEKNEIKRHLNLHDHMNDGLAQKMALIIDKDGKWEIQNNEKL